MATSSKPPALLDEALRTSTITWQNDLQSLFNQAKERFPDVVWELLDENDENASVPEEVWGHKGTHDSSFSSVATEQMDIVHFISMLFILSLVDHYSQIVC